MTNQISSRLENHRVRIEILQSLLTFQTPREDDRIRGLIQLNSPPIRFAVDPEVLGETSVLLLRHIQIDQRPAAV